MCIDIKSIKTFLRVKKEIKSNDVISFKKLKIELFNKRSLFNGIETAGIISAKLINSREIIIKETIII